LSIADKFDGGLHDGQGSHLNGHADVDTVRAHAPTGAIIVPDAQLLFTGDFKRSGVDLILSKDDRELVLQDYFKGEKRAALASPDGAHLTADIVDALTGHQQYAQADGSASVAKVIGHVTKLAGGATAIRNGVSIILNQGDNVNKGDVVQCGSDSTLGLTFIDGTVFGLGSNAKMVLNEMVYDPNGSNNSSLLSLVQGTISFVAGATAKHGDMKVDTPVATMGIRGTAVLVEIDFEVPGQGAAPPAKFQVLVEPDGTTGSYILFDKTTLTPIATVNQAGTQTIVNGLGTVNFLTSVQLSADAQKIITEVFAQKFAQDTNTKSSTHFTDVGVLETLGPIKLASGDFVTPTVLLINVPSPSGAPDQAPSPSHIGLPPTIVAFNGDLGERVGLIRSSTIDTVSGQIRFTDVNAGDRPTASATFNSFAYHDAQHKDITATLTAEQLTAIKAVELPLVVVQDPGNNNNGSATWTYSIADGAFDFLAEGQTLTLTYLARVDDNFAPNNEAAFAPITITITGTNDVPTIAATGDGIAKPIGSGNAATDVASGTITFADPDLTDRPVVSTALASSAPFKYLDAQGHDITATLTPAQLAAIAAVEVPLTVVQVAGNTHNGSATWTYSVSNNALSFIANGDTLILNYVAQVDDGHGGVVSTPVSVTLTFTNEAPTLADVNAGTLTDTAANDSFGNLTGTLVGTDPNAGETATLTYAALDAGSHPVTSAVAGLYGSLTVNADGTYSYVPNAAAINALHAGTYADIFTVQTTDVHGATGTATFTVNVTGANDTATISGQSTGSVVEDYSTATSGTLTVHDVDSGEAVFFPVPAKALSGAYGNFTFNDATGAWTYTLAHAKADSLTAGQVVHDILPVVSADGTASKIIDITITGTNDAATISGKATGSVEDGAGTTTSGKLTVHDVDHGEAVFQAVPAAALAGAYGNFTFDSVTGAWTYALVHAEADSLTAGQVVHDTLTVASADGTALQLIDVTVTGSNDAPVIVNEADPQAQAVMVVDPISAVVLAPGVNTNSLGLNTETFDSVAAGSASNNGTGHGSFYSAALDATFSASGSAGVVAGSSSITAAPFLGPLPGILDPTNYLSIGGGGVETITFASEKNAFGLYWGSVDFYNTIKFYDGTTLVASYTGADVSPLFAIGVRDQFASNGYVEFTGLHLFDKVVLTGDFNSFELDNISAGSVPAPHTQLAAPVVGTLSVHDSDIGDTLTGAVTGNGTIEYNGSTVLPAGIDVAALIDAADVKFDSVQSDGGTDILHWTYKPTNADLDFLHAGDVLTIKFTAEVNDGHVNVGSQPLTVTLVGANNATNLATFGAVNGTSGNDMFNNVGGNVTVFGGGGQNSFVFKPGFGSATIADFDVNKDTIFVSQNLFATAANILAAAAPANSGHDTIITDAAHDTIMLTGVTVAQLQAHPNDFHLI
jgi:VCBS repeat-containing protein